MEQSNLRGPATGAALPSRGLQDKVLNRGVLVELLLALKPITPETGRMEALRPKVLEEVRAIEQDCRTGLTLRAEGGVWIRLSPLVEMKMLHRNEAGNRLSCLLRMQAGGSVSAHPSADEEWLVLEGEVRVGDFILRAGDYHLSSPGVPQCILRATTEALLFAHSSAHEGLTPAGDSALIQINRPWISRVHQAFQEERLCLYYQPLLPLSAGAAGERHYEILLRMKDGQGGQAGLSAESPLAFIPVAERYELMPTIDRWVICSALATLAQSPGPEQGLCSMNLSGWTLCDDSFLDFIIEQLNLYGVPPAKICFELSELEAISDLSHARHAIATLKEMGCRFALDDFGSNPSSLDYLEHLPVDYLKIDGRFIKDMLNGPGDYALVETLTRLGHDLHIQIIGKSVENEALLESIRRLGVDFAQGFGVVKPKPWEA